MAENPRLEQSKAEAFREVTWALLSPFLAGLLVLAALVGAALGIVWLGDQFPWLINAALIALCCLIGFPVLWLLGSLLLDGV